MMHGTHNIKTFVLKQRKGKAISFWKYVEIVITKINFIIRKEYLLFEILNES